MKALKLFYNISKVKENLIRGTPFSRRGQFGLTHTHMPGVICDITSLNINMMPIYCNNVR